MVLIDWLIDSFILYELVNNNSLHTHPQHKVLWFGGGAGVSFWTTIFKKKNFFFSLQCSKFENASVFFWTPAAGQQSDQKQPPV